MSRASLFFVLCCASVAVPLGAHQAKPVTPPPTVPPNVTVPVVAAPTQTAPTPKPAASAPPTFAPVNVRVELAIEETAGGTSSNKNVLLITSNGDRGSVRSAMRTQTEGEVVLNVDARPRTTADGRISLELVFVYTPQRPSGNEGTATSNLTEQLNVFLTDGKKTTIAESADPRGDRKVSVGVTATVLK